MFQIKTLLHLGRPFWKEMGTVGCGPKRASKGQGRAEPRAELGVRLRGEVSGKTGQGDRGAGRCGRVGWGPDGSILLRVSAPQRPQALQLVAMATAGPGLCVRPLLPMGGPLAKPWPLTS